MTIMAKLHRLIHALFVPPLLLLLLSGCSWGSHELSHMALVMGAGLDRTDDGRIELTLQVFVPRAASTMDQGSGPGSSGTESMVLVKSATGENVAEAALNLQRLFSRQIFWGQCDTYIIGEKLAKDGTLNEQIDFINRHPQPRSRANLFISHGEAAKILSITPSLERYMGDVLEKISDLNFKNTITVKDFQQMSQGESKGSYLPFLQISKKQHSKKASETIAEISGLAIFEKGKMTGLIKGKEMKCFLWTRNQIVLGTITAETPGGRTISLHPLRQSAKVVPKVKNGKWRVTVHVHVEGMLTQNDSYLNVMEPASSKRAEGFLEKEIKKDIEQSVHAVKDEIGTDAFGFGDAFHRTYPKEWKKVKDQWDSFLPYVDSNVTVQLKIKDPGLVNKTIGLAGKR